MIAVFSAAKRWIPIGSERRTVGMRKSRFLLDVGEPSSAVDLAGQSSNAGADYKYVNTGWGFLWHG